MRDYAVFGVTAVGLALTLWRPWIGVLLYAWFAYMNPHRLCYGPAFNFPFSLVVVIVLLLSWLFAREPKRLPLTMETVILMLFTAWMTVTTFTALDQAAAWLRWEQVMKIMFMAFVIFAMLRTRERLDSFVWVVVLSLGYYGVRGTIGTLNSGGAARVYGPDGTFIADNNDLALAMVTVIPLVIYAWTITSRRLVRMGLLAVVGCLAIAVMGTASRAGALALVAILSMLCWKSKYRLRTTLAAIAVGCLVYFVAPAQWFARVQTIGAYEHDRSAQGRLNAWRFAVNLVQDYPITGGGFEAFNPKLFLKYAPERQNFHAAHSIYFKILGEQGFVGLTLFVMLWASTWRTARQVIRLAQDMDAGWAEQLAAMAQIALVGYGIGGAFGNLSYFDLPYHLVAIIVGCKIVLAETAEEHATEAEGSGQPASSAETVYESAHC